MKNKKLNHIKLFVTPLIITTLIFAAWIVLKKSNRNNIESDFKKQVAHDAEMIRKEGPKNESEYAGALIRLGSMKDAKARTQAITDAHSNSQAIKSAAANALGFFDDDEAIATLSQLTEDPDTQVRIQAYRALGNHSSEKRHSILQNSLTRTHLEVDEKVAIYQGLSRGPISEKLRNSGLQDLLKYANNLNEPYGSSIRALIAAISLAPKNPQLIEFLRRNLKPTGNFNLSVFAVRHLSAIADPWLRDHLNELISTKDIPLRIATVQSIHLVCPKDRWAILESLMKTEKEDTNFIKVMIEEISLMPGEDATRLLKRIADQKLTTNPELNAYLQKANQKVSAQNAKDPCDPLEKTPQKNSQ